MRLLPRLVNWDPLDSPYNYEQENDLLDEAAEVDSDLDEAEEFCGPWCQIN